MLKSIPSSCSRHISWVKNWRRDLWFEEQVNGNEGFQLIIKKSPFLSQEEDFLNF